MRIAYVSTYPPIECGIGTYTSYLNEEIKKHDNETFIISQIGAQGKNVFPIFRAQSVSIGDQVFKITAKITPDLVHIQHEYGLYGPQKGVQIVGLILRYRLVDVPVVITLHTVSPKLRHYEEIILQSIVNGCSAIIVHEGRQKETLVKYFGQAKKIHVIPHGVREISPVKDAKKKLEVEGKKVILLCGYFRPTKGFHKIVEIFPKVCEKVNNAVLMIAGKSRGLEYKDYQKEFFEAINSSSVNDKILVLRGQFPQKTFDTIISASDVVALPYEIGGQSGVMAHCYAFSKPVVTSALPAFKKSVERSKGGLTCETKQDYVKNIIELITNDNLRHKMQTNIRNYVKDQVGWGKIARSHVKVYQSVVKVPYGKARHVFWE